jgi:hypothetical protein
MYWRTFANVDTKFQREQTMTTKIPRPLYKQVRRRSDSRGEYCQSSEWLTAQRHHVDHVHERQNLRRSTAKDSLLNKEGK